MNKETGRSGDPRIHFLNIELLDGIIHTNSKKITLKINSSSVKLEEVKKLKAIINKYKGNKPLYFDIIDKENEFKLNMISEDLKVSISRDLLISLEKENFEYHIQ